MADNLERAVNAADKVVKAADIVRSWFTPKAEDPKMEEDFLRVGSEYELVCK